jgi:TP901 family phage tail tape measure protein
MATAKIPVEFDPVVTSKVDAALARIQSKAKGIDFGGGARSLDKLSRPLGKITGQATEFQKSLEASNARVLAFGASVAVINKLSQAFSALIANTIKVEATFAKINTILGGTDKQLQQFGNGIFKVAQKTATSFDDVAEGALELARQGLSVEESLSRVETALKLVRVAGVSSEQAVAGLTAAIKGFEGAGLTVAAIGDKLSEVDTKFAVSTEDLINGLERASASARVAGVSFDELLAVVTTVQERTQRGGAVIGNAFKTIFARLGRTDTLSALEELGINVLDTQGNVRSAIPLFQELAGELNKLGLKSVEAGDIIQKVAGVRQRDILISLVEDLNSSQSQFSKALQTSATAAGALDSKNASLNQTLEALINNLTVGGQKLASVLGELGFTDAVKDILKVFSSVVNGLTDLLQGDSIGAKFAQGIVKGIGGVLTGPGLALVGAIFIKLFVDLAKFGTSSLASLLGINKAAQQQAALQQSVLQTLLQNENIQREILALEGNKVAQEQLLLKIYNQQAAALARVQKAAAVVTPGLFGSGLRGGSEGVKGRAAGGYIASESRDVSRGVGGAPSSAKVVSIPNFAFGGGKRGTMVANTSEYVVPNYAGGGDAIFNQDMVRSMGLPAGAKKLNAAGGFVPNFAKRQAVPIQDPRFALITPDKNLGKFAVGKSKTGKSYQFPILGYNDS